MTRPFSVAYKQKMVERLTGGDAPSARKVAQETGVSQQTLSRWVLESRNLALMVKEKRKGKVWSVDEKIRVLAEAAKLAGREVTALLEREGLSLTELTQWRLALEEEGRSSKATTKCIRQLERELARKEKALAEAAALLVLKKK